MRHLTVLLLAGALAAAALGAGTEPPQARAAARVAEVETLYLDVMNAGSALGAIDSGLFSSYQGRDRAAWEAELHAGRKTLNARLAGFDEVQPASADAAALAAMRRSLASIDEEGMTEPAGDAAPACKDAGRRDLDYGALRGALVACFREIGNHLRFEDRTVDRGSALQLLQEIEEPARRRALFDAFGPLWRALNGGGEADSAYRRMIRMASDHAARDGSEVDAAARAIGVTVADVERWLVQVLDAWRQANGPEMVEPWDYRYSIGEAGRRLAGRIPAEALVPANERFFRDLGADLATLGIVYDLAARPDKSPVAYTDFLVRGRYVEGKWQPTVARVVGTYPYGGLFSLNELVHENGHAVQISAIRNRPAYTDWADTLLVEAFADVPSWSVYEPAWQRRYLGADVTECVSLRALYGTVMLDVAWALFEIRMLREPTLDPNTVWTDITSQYLRIVPHSEVPWWAMRVQLASDPGYMVNYGLGAVLTAEMRRRVAEAIGPFDAGNPAWYGWLSDRLLVFGSERDTLSLMQSLLGRPVSPAALIEQLGRCRA
jgi:hypothetical protein